ncbi:alpha/beta-hydrolase [Ophiobolus disseminans]|uniref:Alpha/beta-hydrolase n=1 Tax=Ophiobolus disseminans TaxID=1469910 RepID=A0A6A6ZES7_9PLEO|nr:alpha/beta-hydrolase [Ophiobolus disseminans]
MSLLPFLSSKLSLLPRLISPTTTALSPSPSPLPLHIRLRLLLLQPLNVLAALLISPYWLLSTRYTVTYIPTRHGSCRCLIFLPRGARQGLAPLHIDVHGGGWVGGFAEQDARWCGVLSDRAGAVVVSVGYRIAPAHIYPAAHDDVADILTYLIAHARDFGADATLLTVGGSSVGGGLALCAAQTQVPLAYVGFCPALDFRVSPGEKSKPVGFPRTDPLKCLLPLFDVYAGEERAKHLEDAKLHPILAGKDVVPRDVLVVGAEIDVLLAEQVDFVKRLKREVGDESERRIEIVIVEGAFHGFMELPSFILEKERVEIFERSIAFIKEAHKKAGYEIDKKR